MKLFNLFYITVIAVGIGLYYLFQVNVDTDLSFYGFAESNETEINYNYPVIVKKINIQPGQSVQKGDALLELVRRNNKEALVDQGFRINELKADREVWLQKKKNEISVILQRHKIDSVKMITKIMELRKELEYKKSLAKGLQSVKVEESNYNPIEEELRSLKAQMKSQANRVVISLDGIKKEMAKGINPIEAQIKRLRAEQQFDLDHIQQEISVTAPSDGLIGNISCKEEEHIPSYATLLSFYEPHSRIIKGYIHEDLTHHVSLGDLYNVSSLKSADIIYEARVTGLGSRIVEIPSRLRKIPEMKTYGREVLLEVPANNVFLQKEKVSVYAHIQK